MFITTTKTYIDACCATKLCMQRCDIIAYSIYLNIFLTELNSTLISQLTGKGNVYGHTETPFPDYVVFVLDSVLMLGIGVSTFRGTVLVHKNIVGNIETVQINYRPIDKFFNAKLLGTQEDIALFTVRSSFNQKFCCTLKSININFCIFYAICAYNKNHQNFPISSSLLNWSLYLINFY